MSDLRVAINAVSIRPGGGLTGLMGLLQGASEIAPDLRLVAYVAVPATMAAIAEARPDIVVKPFAEGRSSAAHFAMQQALLGPKIEHDGADVVWTTNTLVGRCRIPQLVHHRNLRRFEKSNPASWLAEGRPSLTVKDLAARKALRDSAVNVFISQYHREKAEAIVPASAPRNNVVYHGVSEELRKHAIGQHAVSAPGGPNLAAVQSLQPHKDNQTLIRTLAILADRQPDVPWKLTVAGGGDWAPVIALAGRLGVADRVTFAGFMQRPQLASLLRGSLCLVYPSFVEAFGQPPLEAMAWGCPVIAARATAIPEIVGNAALLVEPRRPEEFAEAIIRLYGDGALRGDLISRGFRRVQDFSWVDSARRLAGLLRRAAENRR